MDIIATLATGPLPTILVFFGALSLLLAIIGRLGGSIIIDISPRRQVVLVLAGLLFITAGMMLFIRASVPTVAPPPYSSQPTDQEPNTPTPTLTFTVASSTPTLTPTTELTIEKGEKAGVETPPTATPTLLFTPSPVVLFEDDFDAGLRPEWEWDRNRWRVTEKRLVNTGCGEIVAGDQSWTQLSYKFDVQLPQDSDGNLQALFAVTDREDKWAVALLTDAGIGAVSLFRYVSGELTWIRGVQSQRNNVFRANVPVRVEITVAQSSVGVVIDGVPVYDVDLQESLTGQVGLKACPGAFSWIDNLQVLALEGSENHIE